MTIANRPLSPHLQVYKPQLTSILSITHRATGIALVGGSLLLVIQLLSAASGPEAFACFQGFIGSWFGLLLLFGWSVSLFYHLANGIRHLVWDAGCGLELDAAYQSGKMVVIATGALTVLSWLIAILFFWGAK